ncbi:site-specific integrase [Bacillus sp. NSP9.1]|uniref:site-specific integrase n=1 Tax=Bacillus sp. NSP9.1 TaxID=1071078 RepID=UPI00042342BB|nr:site-specific integrase [Bacillus sp. NSP9.1]QHZ45084.1 tyrosine-type recombinase/integrase [Bacillus sp. NSP9.1]
MRVQKIYFGKRNTYLLLDSNGVPVQAVAKYMKHLYNKDNSSNTMLTYCTALKHFFTYLEQEGLSYYQVNFEVLTNFVAWLRNPYQANKIVPHKETTARRKEKTVNVYLSAVTSFYDYLYRTDLIEKKTNIYITPHLFRHTHGTTYYLQTKNIKMVQERLGHSDIQTTINLYLHPSDDEIREDWEKAAIAFKIATSPYKENQ